MTESRPGGVSIFKISQILDRNTVAVTGAGIDELTEGQDLIILAVGKPLPDTVVPLVVPKAQLEVTLAAGAYVLARPPEVTERIKSNLLDMMSRETTHRVRPDLSVADNDIGGNPARQPVRIGDIVIRKHDLKAYVQGIQGTST